MTEETQLRWIENTVWVLWTLVFLASFWFPYIAVAFLGWRYIASLVNEKPWKMEEKSDE